MPHKRISEGQRAIKWAN